MLAGKYGLKGYQNFKRVEREGKIFQSDSFGISIFDRKDQNTSLFGFIVSNKVSPESTLRNRVKRAMKEAVRFSLPAIRPGCDVVFLTKQKAIKESTDAIMQEVREALKKVGLTK